MSQQPSMTDSAAPPPPGPAPSAGHATERFVRHARTFAALTLTSRVMGLARDALLVRALGVSAVCTAFNIAFQLPNTFRRLFGEGALSAAFIPEYAQLEKREPALAARFASLNVALLAGLLGALVVLLEAGLLATLAWADLGEHGRQALVYLAVMLPYMPLVCVTALLGGMLQTHGRFAAQAGAPIILNACMIAGAWVWGYALEAPPARTALVVSFGVAIAGVLQVAWCLWDLRHHAHWTRIFTGAAEPTRRMLRRMGPVVVGLGAVQIATLIESWVLVGWPLYFGETMFGRAYPLDASAGAALYNAQRLYQFPLGVFGIALATAVFPLLARQADDAMAFISTLRRGLRLSLLIGLPATAGLVMVAHDLTATVYLGGEVTPDAAARMARLLIAYAPLVGAYSVTHVLTRAFYARGETRLPTRVSILTVILSLALSAGLMWPVGELGLALGSSAAAALQLALLIGAAQRDFRTGPEGASVFDGPTARAIGRIAVATGVMVAALAALQVVWPVAADGRWRGHAASLGARVVAGGAVYLLAALVLCRQELEWLRDRQPARARSGSGA